MSRSVQFIINLKNNFAQKFTDLNSQSWRTNWFHYNVNSGKQAEHLLFSGSDKCFLVWYRKRTKMYMLSIRNSSTIQHIVINRQMSGEKPAYDLGGGDRCCSLVELIERTQQPHMTKGIITLKLENPLSVENSFAQRRWYHGTLSDKDAETTLLNSFGGPVDGDFLVRVSIQQPHLFIISTVADEEVIHIPVNYKDTCFQAAGVDQPAFTTLERLIIHYSNIEVLEKKSNAFFRLGKAITNTRFQAEKSAIKRYISLNHDFDEEYKKIESIEKSLPMNDLTLDANEIANKKKNRYKDILPFDESRVRLTDDLPSNSEMVILNDPKYENDELGDYINASYISPEDDCSDGRNYIACQGPLDKTLKDFWRMIWQENCSVIVMTTKLLEKGRKKCACYWPTADDEQLILELHDGVIRVTHQHEEERRDYTVREWTLERFDSDSEPKGEIRDIYHYHYTAWPDHGVPKDPAGVLNCLEEVDTRQLELGGCVVVHCSAGIGRTGTFIMIDMLLNEINKRSKNRDIDVYRTLLFIRNQRPGMVQTKEQYEFIHHAIQSYSNLFDESGKQVYNNDAMFVHRTVRSRTRPAPAMNGAATYVVHARTSANMAE